MSGKKNVSWMQSCEASIFKWFKRNQEKFCKDVYFDICFSANKLFTIKFLHSSYEEIKLLLFLWMRNKFKTAAKKGFYSICRLQSQIQSLKFCKSFRNSIKFLSRRSRNFLATCPSSNLPASNCKNRPNQRQKKWNLNHLENKE